MKSRNHRGTILWLSIAVFAGCGFEPQAQPLPKQQSQRIQQALDFGPDAETGVKIEVIGTYRNGDADFVRDRIETILPAGVRNRDWGAGGNRCEYEASPVPDVEVVAKQIGFGTVIGIDGRKIRVQYSYDNVIPPRFKTEPTGYYKPPEDLLGPALRKHDGDWWAALGELRATRGRNEQGEINWLHLPAFKTTDETMVHLAELTSLKNLTLSMCRHVTDDGARHLAGLKELETLDLFASRIGNPGQAYLSDLTKLKWLSLSGKGTEDGLRHLANLTRMENLSVGFGNGYPVTTAGLRHLKNMRDLKRLRLDGCAISDEGLALIAGFAKLESLSLQAGIMTDAGLSHLASLTHLRSLDLEDCSAIDDPGVANLRPLVNLTHLNLGGTQLTDDGVEHLQPLTQLSSLWLSGTSVTDAGLRSLGSLPRLRQLNLNKTSITDASLAHLKSFPELDDIWLSETAITDAGLEHLGEITNLKTLRIDGTKITDTGMAYLGELTELRSIDISKTSVTEQGLRHLSKAVKLNDIRANDSGVTREAIQRFKRQ